MSSNAITGKLYVKYELRTDKHSFAIEDDAFLSLLRACAKKKDLRGGTKVHAVILKWGWLEKSPSIANGLLSMYAKCGLPVKAMNLLDGLSNRNVFSWNAVIVGYAQQGLGEEAMRCFEQMQEEGVSADEVTFTCSLKACRMLGATDKGEQIHDEIFRQGLLDKDILLGNALVDMYAGCGALAKAQEVVDKLPYRDVSTWNALIGGYVKQGQYEAAFNSFDLMQCDGLSPNAVTFASVLKACGISKAAAKGEEIHNKISGHGLLGNNVVLGTALVDMYVKCGALGKARKVLEELSVRNVISWSALIAGYAQQGQGEEALKCFELMRQEGLIPNAVTFTCILKACGSTKALEIGEQIHDEVARQGLLWDNVVLGTALVDMYAKCGALEKAESVLEQLSVGDVVLWNALIAGYVHHGQGKDALCCYERMQSRGVPQDEVTFLCILKSCSSLGALDKGEKIHDEIAKAGFLTHSSVLGNALVDMYAKCGALTKAQLLLEELSVGSVVAWNALMSGYIQHGQGRDALRSFIQMKGKGLHPDEVTFTCALKACGTIKAVDMGEEIHDEIAKQGLLCDNIMLGTALVDMYAKCGALGKAQQVLRELPSRNVVSWSALIGGYVQQGQGEEALNCYELMRRENVSPNVVTYTCILKACGITGAVDKGELIHEEIAMHGLLDKNDVLGGALVDMYIKCGVLAKAAEVLEELSLRDVISWNALMTRYVQQGQGLDALNCYELMQDKGICPDEVTFTCILKACGMLGAVPKGEVVHDEVTRQGFLGRSIMVGNALVDMYAKSGALQKAKLVLDALPDRDVVTWSALISGYAIQGQGEEAMDCFRLMEINGLCLDTILFACVLNACSHSGLVDEGQMCFVGMTTTYDGLIPDLEHYSCMVDLFGRAGQFDKAVAVMQDMPFFDNPSAWSSMLGACQKWRDVNVGKWAFEHALQASKSELGAFTCMSNIYAAARMQEGAELVE